MSKLVVVSATVVGFVWVGGLWGDEEGPTSSTRLKQPAIVQPPDVLFVGNSFSTDLPLAEFKQPVHRLWLSCQLADGAAGTLTLDMNIPRFDEFGDPVGIANPSPLVKLDCTLKFIKRDNDRTLYEIRGPKIVSRLSFVAYKDIMPWGDGRLLVHGKDGAVRYVIDLFIPRPEPASPGAANAAKISVVVPSDSIVSKLHEVPVSPHSCRSEEHGRIAEPVRLKRVRCL